MVFEINTGSNMDVPWGQAGAVNTNGPMCKGDLPRTSTWEAEDTPMQRLHHDRHE